MYEALVEGRAHHAPQRAAGLRREGRHVPAGPLRQGRLPALPDAGPVRRQLRELRRHLLRRPTSSTRYRSSPARGRCERESEHIFFRLGDFEADAAAVDPLRHAADGGRQQAGRVVRRGPARLGRVARRALLRLRDPGRAGQVLLRLARRAGRLHGELRQPAARRRGLVVRRLLGRRAARAELHHFIGKDILYFHSLFWPATLEGAGFRKPTRRARPRLPDGQRREDVEVARHLRHRAAAISTVCRPSISAISSRPSSGPGSRTST